jgi:putative membrane protein
LRNLAQSAGMNAEKQATTRTKLSLTDELAVERTRLANERTLLAYIRSSLYFSIAGLTLNSFFQLKLGWLLELGFWIVAIGILIFGITRYRQVAKKLNISAFAQKRWHLLMEEEV